jgi:hypothetical protein
MTRIGQHRAASEESIPRKRNVFSIYRCHTLPKMARLFSALRSGSTLLLLVSSSLLLAVSAQTQSPSPSPSPSPPPKQPEGFLTAFWINAMITTIFFLILIYLWHVFPAAAHPRAVRFRPGPRKELPHAITAVDTAYPTRDPTTYPWLLREPSTLLRTIWLIIRYPRSGLLLTAGLDAIAVTAISELGFWFFIGLVVYNFVVQVRGPL